FFQAEDRIRNATVTGVQTCALPISFARAINPITHTNWEGTGVEPDVKVAAADALSTAEKLAGEKAQPAKSSMQSGGREGIRTPGLLVANGESLKLRRVATIS